MAALQEVLRVARDFGVRRGLRGLWEGRRLPNSNGQKSAMVFDRSEFDPEP